MRRSVLSFLALSLSAAAVAAVSFAAQDARDPHERHAARTQVVPEGGTHAIAMTLVGKHPRISVRVEGIDRPLSFVVDTAAGGGVMDAALAERAGLLAEPGNAVSVTGASSTVSANRFTRPLKLAAGGFAWQATMLAMDMSHFSRDGDTPIDGILGNDVLARFDLRFDLQVGQLTLAPPASASEACLANAVAGRQGPLRNFAFVPVRIAVGDGAVDITAVVDTGASQTILNPAAARALGLVEGDPRLRLRGEGTRGLTNREVKTWLYDLPGFSAGTWSAGALEVRVADLPVFASLGQAERPAMILGADALRTARLEISAGAERICLAASGSGG